MQYKRKREVGNAEQKVYDELYEMLDTKEGQKASSGEAEGSSRDRCPAGSGDSGEGWECTNQ